MPTLRIEQAVLLTRDGNAPELRGRSPGFSDAWLERAREFCAAFFPREDDAPLPACVFAQPLGRRLAAVVQAAGQGGAPGGNARFRVLVLPRSTYRDLGGDPFAISERFPADGLDAPELPTLTWDEPQSPHRTVDDVQEVLKRESEGPNLLGGSQALVDGGRIVFERPAPDAGVLQRLWTLLPWSTRADLWPASFARNNALRFDAVVTPHADSPEYAGYLTETQAGDYPEGRYELSLQIAAEAGDQRELDALFARRSRAETWRLGLTLLVLSIVLVFVAEWLTPRPVPDTRPAARPGTKTPDDTAKPAQGKPRRE